MESEDSSDVFMSTDAFVERYFSGPSYHGAAALAGDGDDFNNVAPMSEDAPEEAGALPALNTDDPHDFQGSPISKDQYIDIPLSAEYAKLVSVKIKRTSFVRQKVSRHYSRWHTVNFFLLAEL